MLNISSEPTDKIVSWLARHLRIFTHGTETEMYVAGASFRRGSDQVRYGGMYVANRIRHSRCTLGLRERQLRLYGHLWIKILRLWAVLPSTHSLTCRGAGKQLRHWKDLRYFLYPAHGGTSSFHRVIFAIATEVVCFGSDVRWRHLAGHTSAMHPFLVLKDTMVTNDEEFRIL